MIAAPGGGKGTQGERLAAKFSVQHVVLREVLLAEASAGTPVGRATRSVTLILLGVPFRCCESNFWSAASNIPDAPRA